MDKVCKSFLPTKLHLFKALSSKNSLRNHVYHAQRIVKWLNVQVAMFFGQFQNQHCMGIVKDLGPRGNNQAGVQLANN